MPSYGRGASNQQPDRNILRFDANADESRLREAIVEAGRIGYAKGFLSANNGNISVRLDAERILITPSGLCKGRMVVDDLFVVSTEGAVLEPAADPSLRISSETPMHVEALKVRQDMRAVVHAHPVYAIALSVAEKPLQPLMVPEVAVALGHVPTSDFGLPSSADDARIIRELIQEHDALILRNHGSLTVGRHLDEALIHLERMEHAAEVQVLAELLGKVSLYPSQMFPALAGLRRAMFADPGPNHSSSTT